MNDERAGQLASSKWRIPAYARKLLWLETPGGTVATEGDTGLFTLLAPAPHLTIRWGSAQGSMLAQLAWQPDSLEWDGTVRLGGTVETIHLTEFPGLDVLVAVIMLEGQPVLPAFAPYPTAQQRHTLPETAPDWLEFVDRDCDPTITTWLIHSESPLFGLAQDAMHNGHQVYFYGHLAEEKGGWHKQVALPLMLEAMTLFAQ